MDLIKFLPKFAKKWVFNHRACKEYDRRVDAAERKHRSLNTMVYIIPDPDNKLVLVTRDGFRECKRKGIVPSNFNMNDIQKGCVYHTCGLYQNNKMDEKERKERRDAYIQWYIEHQLLEHQW